MQALLNPVVIICPICSHPFDSQVLFSKEFDDLKDFGTDFHHKTQSEKILRYMVHLCPDCGYCGPKEIFDNRPRNKKWKEKILASLTFRGRAENISTLDKLEAAIATAELREDAYFNRGELNLWAAWCCKEIKDSEAERYFQRQSAKYYQISLELYEPALEDRAHITFIVGELWRRMGDFYQSEYWLKAVKNEILLEEDSWLNDLAVRQRADPEDFIE